MTNQNRIEIHTTKPTPKKVGSADVKILRIKDPGIKGKKTKKLIKLALEFKKNKTYNSHIILMSIPPIIPNLT